MIRLAVRARLARFCQEGENSSKNIKKPRLASNSTVAEAFSFSFLVRVAAKLAARSQVFLEEVSPGGQPPDRCLSKESQASVKQDRPVPLFLFFLRPHNKKGGLAAGCKRAEPAYTPPHKRHRRAICTPRACGEAWPRPGCGARAGKPC